MALTGRTDFTVAATADAGGGSSVVALFDIVSFTSRVSREKALSRLAVAINTQPV
jgi:hypothetical protein